MSSASPELGSGVKGESGEFLVGSCRWFLVDQLLAPTEASKVERSLFVCRIISFSRLGWETVRSLEVSSGGNPGAEQRSKTFWKGDGTHIPARWKTRRNGCVRLQLS